MAGPVELASRPRQQTAELIRASGAGAQWYANYYKASESWSQQQRKPVLTVREPMRDEDGVWRVCLSMHSSREEMERVLWILKSKCVESTTPPFLAEDSMIPSRMPPTRRSCSF